MSYEKVQPGHPAHSRVTDCRAAGIWICDSADHNSGPCSNPDCFNHGRTDLIPKLWRPRIESYPK